MAPLRESVRLISFETIQSFGLEIQARAQQVSHTEATRTTPGLDEPVLVQIYQSDARAATTTGAPSEELCGLRAYTSELASDTQRCCAGPAAARKSKVPQYQPIQSPDTDDNDSDSLPVSSVKRTTSGMAPLKPPGHRAWYLWLSDHTVFLKDHRHYR